MSQPSTNLHVTFDEWNQDYYLQTADGVTVGIAYSGDDTGDAPGIENAYLWAAAPQLRDALLALVEYVEDANPGAALGGDGWVSQLRDTARTALAASTPPTPREVTP